MTVFGGRRVLVLGASAFQLDLIRGAKRLGARVLVADRDGGAPGMALADEPLHIDLLDGHALSREATRRGVEAVVTAGSETALGSLAQVASELGLSGPSPAEVEKRKDKLAVHADLAAAGCAPAPTFEVHDLAGLSAHVERVGGFPCVVKPRRGSGGRGVRIVRAQGELEAALRTARAGSVDGTALVQGFLAGEAFGVEAALWPGEPPAIFLLRDQLHSGFVSPVGHALPAGVPHAVERQVERLVVSACAALGIRQGVVNLDLRIGPDGPRIVELNARPGGSSISELIHVSLGADVAGAAVACALGVSPAPFLQTRWQQPAAARLIVCAAAGRIVAAPSLEPYLARPEVSLCEVAAEASEPPQVNGCSLLGRCIVRGATVRAAVDEAERLAAELGARVRFAEVA